MAESMIKTSDREPVRLQALQYSTGTALTIEPRSYNRLALASPTWGLQNYSKYSMSSAAVPAGATTVKFDSFVDGEGYIIKDGALIDLYVYLI